MTLRARKQFGQHWLQSEAILQQIVAAAHLQTGDRVLEIGPGKGSLTRQLLQTGARVVAVEIDRDLCRHLVQSLGQTPNFMLLQGDILSLDWQALVADFPAFQSPTKVIANIPYNITGPILETLLGTIAQPRQPAFEQLVLLVQKEVADRLCAAPGSRAFGALSVRVQYLAECEIICPVPAKAFKPPPKVESTVIRLTPRPFAGVVQDVQLFDRLVRLGFATKRKMLRNNLKGQIDLAQLDRIFADLAVDPQIRAEGLGVGQWVALSNRLGESIQDQVQGLGKETYCAGITSQVLDESQDEG